MKHIHTFVSFVNESKKVITDFSKILAEAFDMSLNENKDTMKAGFKMNEEVNENEVSYKVAGRPVTLIKGKKSNGLDWKVKFQNGKETLLANVITLINPFPPIK